MPIILALTLDKSKPVRRGSAHYWSVIRELTAGTAGLDRLISVADIVDRSSGADARAVRTFLHTLTGAGLLELTPATAGQPRRWRVLKRPTHLPPMSRSGQIAPSRTRQMWNAMRALPAFTAGEIAIAASIEGSIVQPATAKTYLILLAAAGYLKIERPGAPGRPTVYRLRPVMNTGPLPPKILRTKVVYDQNRNEIVGAAEAEEVAC